MQNVGRILAKTLLGLTVPILLIGIVEVALRELNVGNPTSFLLPFNVNGERVFIDNQLFGYRFFSPAVSRAPSPIVLPLLKATNELRVVVLGESAAMGEPEPAYGPARILERFLRARFPDRSITVINAAMTAINSHVIREISGELKRMQPDAVVLYIGNNEVVGPLGPGTVFDSGATFGAIDRIRVVVTRLRIVSILRSFWFRHARYDQQTWKGMEMFLSHTVPDNDARLEHVYNSFNRNVRDIIADVLSSGAKPILCTVAVNLADQPAFVGEPECAGDDIVSLKKCRDQDQLRFRADSRINTIIRQIAAQLTNDVIFADVETLFEEHGAPGDNYFLDHVHVNLSGSYLLAQSWDNAIGSALNKPQGDHVTFSDASSYVVWNPYGALEIAEKMTERNARPPFSSLPDYRERMTKWTREISDIHRRIRLDSVDSELRRFRDELESRPEDSYLPSQVVTVLLHDNRLADAGEFLQLLRNHFPHRADIRAWQVVVDGAAGNTTNSWHTITRGAPPLGEIPADLLLSASETLYQSRYVKEAAEVLRPAAEHYPGRVRLQVMFSSRLAQAGSSSEADGRFRSLIAKYPDENWIREEYGFLMAMIGNVAGAKTMLSHLSDSAAPEDRMKWVQFLLFARDNEGAEKELLRLINDAPAFAPAYRQLAQLRSKQGRLDDVLPLINRYLEIEPWQGDVWGELGGLQDLLNNPKAAIAAYEKAIRLQADPAAVMRSLAWILATESDADVRNPSRASAIMDSVMKQWGRNDPHSLFVHAAAMAAEGNYPEAVHEVDEAVAHLEPGDNPQLADELTRARQVFADRRAITITRD